MSNMDYRMAAAPGQARLEALALRIAAAPALRQARREAREVFLAHPNAATPDGRTSLEDAADQHFYAAIQRVTNDDPHYPDILVLSSYRHSLGGAAFPAALHGGLENPDNIYRVIPVSAGSAYVLRGRRHQPAPAQLTFELMDTIPGVDGIGAHLGMLMDRDLRIDADGGYTITIDSAPADGRPNHIQSCARARALFIRDTLSDWSTQRPDTLSVERIAGPAAAPRGEEQMIADAARLVPRFARFWNDFRDMYVKKLGHRTNRFDPPFARPGGWGFIANTHFAIAADEAFVFTAYPAAAPYHGVLIGNHWWIAQGADLCTGAFNTAQSAPDSDGGITYVIAGSDPGVHNWLDCGALGSGIIQVRWQGTPPAMTSLAGGIKGGAVVKLARLGDHLPPETVRVDGHQRARQIAARHAAYQRRFMADKQGRPL